MKNLGSKCIFSVFLAFLVISFSASAWPQQVSLSPSSLSFGSVSVGSSKTQAVVVKNITKRRIGIYQAGVSGTGYTISGISCPVNLQVGQSVSFSVTFAPTSAASQSGLVSLVTQNWWKEHRTGPATSTLAMSGSGVSGSEIGATPTSVPFGNVMVGSSKTSAASVINTGTAGVTISGAALSNAAYAVSGLNPPVTLTAGQSLTFNVVFTPVSAGATSGNLAISSDAGNGQLNVALSGSGMSPGQLALTPSSFDFGNVQTGTSASKNGTLTAAGSAVTLSSASSTSPEFVLSGVTFPLTLADGQSIPFAVTFLPQSSGTASASISFFSNATNSPATETLTGTGVAPVPHSVDLSWTASGTPGVVGYYVYRSTVSGGPYNKISSSPEPTLTYSDMNVASGQTYYYVITAQDGGGMESTYSNQATVTVMTP